MSGAVCNECNKATSGRCWRHSTLFIGVEPDGGWDAYHQRWLDWTLNESERRAPGKEAT